MSSSRIKVWAAITAALVAVAVGGTLLATGNAKAAAPMRTKIELLELEDQGFTEQVDAGKAGFGAGDAILENLDLVDPTGGSKVGETITRVDVVRTLDKDNFVAMITCTVKLAKGTIHFVGGATFADISGPGASFPIVGGTGTYAGATGVARVKLGERDGKPAATITLDVTRAVS